ncbi:MAG TPA: HTTM domain-containing protein [Chthoniobacterales bacterium]|nr:HTTM domain-containing protein [Chthoniobacterales bacterium]
MRIGAGAIAIVQALGLLPHLDALVGPYGIVQHPVDQLFTVEWLPRFDPALNFLVSITGCLPETALRVLMIGYVALMMMLLAGCWTTSVKWLCWFAHLALKSTGAAGSYGVSEFLNILFFYLALSPCGEVWSIDAMRRRRHRRFSWESGLLLLTLRLHLCAIYLSSGIGKAVGPMWWNGESIWRALIRERAAIYFSWLVFVPWLAALMGWWTLLVETGYGAAVWFPRTRWVWIGMTLLLHAGIAVFLGLWLFSATMMLLNFCAWAPVLQRDWRTLRQRRANIDQKTRAISRRISRYWPVSIVSRKH